MVASSTSGLKEKIEKLAQQHERLQPQEQEDPLLQGLVPGQSPADRRKSTRFPTATVGRLTAESDPSDTHEIFVTDVSLHGSGFKCTTPLRGSARYRIEIGSGQLHLTATLRVVSCRPRRDGTYDAGGEFV
jgi:hypothetical protein